MNATRRVMLRAAMARLAQGYALVAAVGDQEQDAYDNIPEGFQGSECGKQISTNADDLFMMQLAINELMKELQEITERAAA